MTPERKIRILKNALDTIAIEAKEPIIKVYAQSALDETVDIKEPEPTNSHCHKHNWFGNHDEKCPLCKQANKLKKGQKIKLYFRCAGVISEEERTIDRFNKQFIWTDELIHPNGGKKEQPEKFDRRNGRCVNDNTMFGTCRSIDPQ